MKLNPGWQRQTLALACCFSVLSLTACSDSEVVEVAETTGRPVKLIEIELADSIQQARYPAIVNASQRSDLSFQVSGLIDELPVTQSNQVKKGAVIAKLDARDFRSAVKSAEATYNNAQKEYKRATRLAKQDAIAKNVLEQRKSQRDVAKSQLDTARKSLEDSVLLAPYDGVVASLPVRRSQTISAGTTVASFMNISKLDATINLPASVIAQVPKTEDSSAVVLLDSAPGQEIEATFSEANLVADSASQTYAVTFTFTPPEDLLVLPGMNATVAVQSSKSGSEASNLVQVPTAAVQSGSEGQYVWLLDSDSMTVSKRSVVVEEGIGESMAVSEGLSSGDQIVGAGGAYLSEGMQVTPWNK